MSEVILLDTGPLGFAVHPQANIPNTNQCDFMQWLLACLQNSKRVCIPEISDYELRRELVRRDAQKQIKKLDDLKESLEFIPIDSPTMLKASELWAKARKQGRPTAQDESLDGDMILCAQALNYSSDLVIATTNEKHLNLFVNAQQWNSIVP